MTRRPRIHTPTPIHADEEHGKTSRKKEDAHPVERLELLDPRLPTNMQHLIRRRMIKEEIQHNRQGIHNNAQYIRPPPLQRRVLEESPPDRGPEDGEGDRGAEHEGVDGTAVLVRDQLAEDHVEGELAAGGEPIHRVRRD